MPNDYYREGDPFYCKVTVCNNTNDPIKEFPLFVILEVANLYFFAPSFSDYDNYLADYPEFKPGETEITVIHEINWPSGAGQYSDAVFYAALTDPEITKLHGKLSIFTFSWGY